jgi:hypothetical protein
MIDIPVFNYFTTLFDDALFPSPIAIKHLFAEHVIEAVLTRKDLALFIDNNRVDTSDVYLQPSQDTALLRGSISVGNRLHLVDVYGRSGMFKPSLKLCIDGEWVAGDRF